MYIDLNKKARVDSRMDKLIEQVAKQAASIISLESKINDLPKHEAPPAPPPVDLSSLLEKIPDVAPLHKTAEFLCEEVTRLRLRIRELESKPPLTLPAPVITHVYHTSPPSYSRYLIAALVLSYSWLAYLTYWSL